MKLLARVTSRTPIRTPQNRSSRSDSLAPANGRAGGGQGPFPREGVGDGETLQHETVSPSPGPPLKDPPTSPPHPWMGAPWGDDGGPIGARAAPSLFGRPAKRRRPDDVSSGDSADGVTPSAATGAAFEPLRSLQGFRTPGIPAARLRAWRLTGGTIWRTGRDHSAAAGVDRTSVRPAGSFTRSGKETRPRSPGTGKGRCSLCCR